jgi:hypothetical protein
MMTSDLPGKIEIYQGIPNHLGRGAFIAGDSYLDGQGHLEIDLTVNDDAGERDIQCHEGDNVEFAGAKWKVTKISGPSMSGRSRIATLSRVE